MKRVIRDSMVLLNYWIKDRCKVLVRVPVTSIDATVLVVKFNSTCNSLDQSEPWCFCLNTLQLFPFFLSNMLGNKWMFGLNIWERSICFCWHSFVCAFFCVLLHFFLWLLCCCLLSYKLLVLLPELVDSINHLLDQLHLWVSQPVLVGDVISVPSLTSRLPSCPSRLEMKLLTSGLQLVHTMLCPSR